MNDKNNEEQNEMPPRIYVPYGPAQLMNVSPELQNNEGAWYVLEHLWSGDLRDKILALKTPCQGELPAMYNRALDDAAEAVRAALESLTLDSVQKDQPTS